MIMMIKVVMIQIVYISKQSSIKQKSKQLATGEEQKLEGRTGEWRGRENDRVKDYLHTFQRSVKNLRLL